MIRRTLLPLAGMTALWLAYPSPALAAFNLKVQSFSYDTHFHPGELITFHVTVANNETTGQFIEVDITLTNLANGQEITLVPVLTGSTGPQQAITLTRTYAVPAEGSYSVSFPVFDGNGDRADTARGKFAIHIGTETESLRVFPEVLSMGTLPPGRTLCPTPLEVRWSFFQFNRLRQDQPFSIRIYTDNAARYHGIPHALRASSPAGLVSMDGRYAIPIKCWMLNFGPDIQETGWDASLAGPPPVDEDDFWLGPPLLEGGRSLGSANWVRIPDLVDMSPNPVTWRRLIGQDQYDNRFVSDINPVGDFTLKSPFTVYLATETGPSSVEGSYAANLVVELWNP